MFDLQDKFGIFAKDSDLLKAGANLKNVDRAEEDITSDFSKASFPEVAKGKIFSVEDSRFKSGGNVVSFPQTAIGVVIVHFKNGIINRATGSVVGPNHVLTAAHALWNRGMSNADNQITKI